MSEDEFKLLEDLKRRDSEFDKQLENLNNKRFELEKQLETKENLEELQRFDTSANRIFESPTFKQRFCEIATSKRIERYYDVLDIVGSIGAAMDLGLIIPAIITIKIFRFGVNQYCKEYF